MRSVGLLLLLGLTMAPAHAFVLHSVVVDGDLRHPRWNDDALPAKLKLNNRTLELLPNVSRSSTLIPSAQAAMRPWGIDPAAIMLDGSVATASIARDGVNLITLADTAVNRDVTRNAWAITVTWFREQGAGLPIFEADVVMNPTDRFATDGSSQAGDFQGILTHELGHVLGLGHSLMPAATLFPGGMPGQLNLRNLDADDLSAQRVLYSGSVGPDVGAISGRVLTTGGASVFGAYVTAVDADGIVQSGVLTDYTGNFTVPALPPNAYRLYAEPLDGPMTPDHLSGEYFHDRRHPILTTFRTTFLGGNASPTTVRVQAGQTTASDPIRVDTQKPTINPWGFVWTEDFQEVYEWVASIRPGRELYLLMAGPGLEKVPTASITTNSSEVAIDYNQVVRDVLDDGTPLILVTLNVNPRARPGARSLYLAAGGERTVLTGSIEVSPP